MMKIKVVIWEEDGVWCGSVPALPGCHTWCDSYEHLMEMLKDAIQGWLEVASERKNRLDAALFLSGDRQSVANGY
jgi:predicted RNase H-like HicB family nuclease